MRQKKLATVIPFGTGLRPKYANAERCHLSQFETGGGIEFATILSDKARQSLALDGIRRALSRPNLPSGVRSFPPIATR